MKTRSAGRSLFHNLAWGIAISMFVIHVIGAGWYGHEWMLARAETFARSTIDGALVYRDLDDATRATLGLVTIEDFRARISATHEPVPGDLWRHNEEVQTAVAAALVERPNSAASGTIAEY